ncbi:hypothetical protein Lal_00024050 [Lupinus albus]|nr:hypothetical protein Lal_00024050 [Lupinus albus]
MKRSELEAVGCKLHPNNKKQQGVCSFCLSDKLLKLNHNNETSSSASSSLACPQYFSYAKSNYVSYSNMSHFNGGLKKSKSFAFVPSNKFMDMEDNRGNKRSKKIGFWSKLLKLINKEG